MPGAHIVNAPAHDFRLDYCTANIVSGRSVIHHALIVLFGLLTCLLIGTAVTAGVQNGI
jgi:hypothetical protein